jgi:hypothetical protein
VLTLGMSHLSTIALVAGAPVLVATAFAVRSLVGWNFSDAQERVLAVVTVALLCGLGGMLAVSVLFTVSLAGVGPYETLTRLHGRYYEHLLVLVAICGLLAAPRVLQRIGTPVRWGLALVTVVLLLLAARECATLGWQNFNDFSVPYAIFASPLGRYWACLVGILSVMAAVAVPRKSDVALGIGLVVWLGINAYQMESLRYDLAPKASDRASEVVARAEAGGDRAKVLVLSPDLNADLYRIAFQLLNEDASVRVGPPATDCPDKSAQLRWVVTIGGEPLACNAGEVVDIEGIKVGRIAPTQPSQAR